MGYIQIQFCQTVIGNGENFHNIWQYYHTDDDGRRDGKQLEIEVYAGNLKEVNFKGKYSAFEFYITDEWIIFSSLESEHYIKIKNTRNYILRVKEE